MFRLGYHLHHYTLRRNITDRILSVAVYQTATWNADFLPVLNQTPGSIGFPATFEFPDPNVRRPGDA